MTKKTRTRASYRAGIAWIAMNDEPGDRDPESVAGYISTMLLADLFGKTPDKVGEDIVRWRVNEKVGEWS